MFVDYSNVKYVVFATALNSEIIYCKSKLFYMLNNC